MRMRAWTRWRLSALVMVCVLAGIAWGQGATLELPEAFDLRDLGHVTSVKNQRGGTCWTHGTLAAIEGNLLISGLWSELGFSEPPNLAEYHLDWWNGFNSFNNDDLGGAAVGLTVHEGGDYLVSAAYLSRGDGAVYTPLANSNNERDDPWYNEAPARRDPDYLYFYPRDIEWYIAGEDLANLDVIKRAVVETGVVATCMCYSGQFFMPFFGGIHYQPPTNPALPNHSVAIVGWDDKKQTQAPQPGAWLIKNSWGSGWNDQGYFWISYYDKWCGQKDDMGAVAFKNVKTNRYDHFYCHDYHGWRDTYIEATAVFNAFVAGGLERLESVSFYTAADNVGYTVKVYDQFTGGQLAGELASASGTIQYRGFHTIDLPHPTVLTEGDDFYIFVELSQGGYAYDRTSEVELLLDGPDAGPQPFSAAAAMGKMLLSTASGVLVESTAKPGQSYYRTGSTWSDFYEVDSSANFCVKALTTDVAGRVDLDRDSRVDLMDLAMFARTWGCQAGETAWNPDADIHADETIDALDLAALTQYWMKPLGEAARWRFDESSGNKAADDCGPYDADVFGNPLWRPDAGRVGGALEFDGADDFVRTPFVIDPTDAPLSVFAWIKTSVPGRVILAQEDGAVWLKSRADHVGTLMTELKGPGRPGTALYSDAVVADGQWHHVGLVWDGSTRILYVDQQEVARDGQLPVAPSQGGFLIGVGPNADATTLFRGLIDDVRLYRRVVMPSLRMALH